MEDDQPKTGVNKAWAQSELTKKSKKGTINIHNIPKDASLPRRYKLRDNWFNEGDISHDAILFKLGTLITLILNHIDQVEYEELPEIVQELFEEE